VSVHSAMKMHMQLNESQQRIVDSVGRIMNKFGDDYWLERDRTGEFPTEFHAAMAAGGWLGIAMPESAGGSGLGIFDAALLMHTVACSGGAMSAASSIHINIFGPHPIVTNGTAEQKRAWLPDLVAGKTIACFAVTEPDAGLDTGRISTRAVRDGDQYRVDGQKIWTSTAQVADKIMLLTRTTERDQVARSVDGLTLFYTDLDRSCIEIREIDKMGRKSVDSNMLFIDNLRVPVAHRVGEEGQGFSYLLDGLNPERILIAAEAIGIGQQALLRATDYARQRQVFGRSIGMNQAIAHPLAKCWMQLQAAWLMTVDAASRYDRNLSCGVQANSAKYLAGEAAFKACERAVLTHGGMGYAKEFHVERLLREVLIPRIAPVSPEMILNYISERVLDLPRSY